MKKILFGMTLGVLLLKGIFTFNSYLVWGETECKASNQKWSQCIRDKNPILKVTGWATLNLRYDWGDRWGFQKQI